MNPVIRAVVLVAAVFAGGCATAPPRFFLLTAPPSTATAPSAVEPTTTTLGVGPIELAGHLARPQLLRRGGAELVVDDQQRWGAPLDDQLSRLLVAQLQAQQPQATVLAFPWADDAPPQWRWRLTVDRCEVVDGDAVFAGQWHLRGPQGDAVVASAPFAYRQAVADAKDGTTIAQVLGGLVAQLATTWALPSP